MEGLLTLMLKWAPSLSLLDLIAKEIRVRSYTSGMDLIVQ